MFRAPQELIVVARPEAELRAAGPALTAAPEVGVDDLQSLLDTEGITLQPLFGAEERLKMEAELLAPEAEASVPDLSVYYKVDAPPERHEELAEKLGETEAVLGAYVKPGGEPPTLTDALPMAGDAPPVSPNFTGRQGYLNPAPGGVDARFAWTQPGGTGTGVRVIDCEWAWQLSHEDLKQNSGGVVAGVQIPDQSARNHGTAVAGVIGADNNSFGVTGISHGAMLSMGAFVGPALTTSVVIRLAALRLNRGDVMLLEIHRPGPRSKFLPRDDQFGYIAIEWWPDDFDAIAFAASLGIIVVEAAGNGAQNLDDPIYDAPAFGFPPTWSNPFRRGRRDSGAILVGAGAPPAFGQPDRSRLDFSNFGAAIDAQGWGRTVTTCGYGDLQGGNDENLWYTETFSGTSSASPIVTGAVACLQGVLRARSLNSLSPAQVRTLLRTTGSPQTAAPGAPVTQRIGNRPDLRALIPAAVRLVSPTDPKTTKDTRDTKNVQDTKDNKDTKDGKDIKDAPDNTKNQKDTKDDRDTKNTKDNKDNKDHKDTKDTPDNVKNTKDQKDDQDAKSARDAAKNTKDGKDNKDGKDARDKAKEIGIEFPSTPGRSLLEDRVQRLEDTIRPFINEEMRPPLESSALRQEPDITAADLERLSNNLQQQADEAKSIKDDKDAEKPSEA